MARHSDLTYGHGLDDVLDTIRGQLGGDIGDTPLIEAFSLLLIDEYRGLHQESDYILVTPGYAMWLLYEIEFVDPTLTSLFKGGDWDESAEDESTQSEFERRIIRSVFEARVGAPDELPAIMRDRTLRLRVMSEHNAAQLEAMHTVREDGTLIDVPRGITRIEQ